MVFCGAFTLRKRERLPKRGRRKEEKLVTVQRKSSSKVKRNCYGTGKCPSVFIYRCWEGLMIFGLLNGDGATYNCPWTMRQLGRAGAWAFKAAQVAVPSFRRKHNARFFWVKLVAFEKLK